MDINKELEMNKLDEIEENAQYKCKPSDLPIYAPLHSMDNFATPHPKESAARKAIEEGIFAARVLVFKEIVDFIDISKDRWKFIYNYLNEPENNFPRTGAIALGGFTGFLLALRGGYMRRLLYTSLGTGAIASLCYPKEVEKYAHNLVTAYNFAVGVKAEDDKNTISWPKFPTMNISKVSKSIFGSGRNS